MIIEIKDIPLGHKIDRINIEFSHDNISYEVLSKKEKPENKNQVETYNHQFESKCESKSIINIPDINKRDDKSVPIEMIDSIY